MELRLSLHQDFNVNSVQVADSFFEKQGEYAVFGKTADFYGAAVQHFIWSLKFMGSGAID